MSRSAQSFIPFVLKIISQSHLLHGDKPSVTICLQFNCKGSEVSDDQVCMIILLPVIRHSCE